MIQFVDFVLDIFGLLLQVVDLLLQAVDQCVAALGCEEHDIVLRGADLCLQRFVHTNEPVAVGEVVEVLVPLLACLLSALAERFALLLAGFAFCLEERVAGSGELLPYIVGILACHGSDLLPLLLQFDERLCRFLPLLAGLEFLRLGEQFALEFQVLGEHVSCGLVVRSFGFVELFAQSAVLVVHSLVELLGCIADGSPLLLNSLYAFACFVPRLVGLEFGEVDALELLDKRLFVLQVLLLALMDSIEVCLVLLVDDSRSSFE